MEVLFSTVEAYSYLIPELERMVWSDQNLIRLENYEKIISYLHTHTQHIYRSISALWWFSEFLQYFRCFDILSLATKTDIACLGHFAAAILLLPPA